MAFYQLQDATLNGVEGRGYAYPIKTFKGKEYRGVFFAEDEDAQAAVVEAVEAETAEFTGTVYERTKSPVRTFDVNVTETVSSGLGERADFEALEKP
ncbi:MAG: hypothetical protein AAFP18_10200 [Bacteroidota bacterium]